MYDSLSGLDYAPGECSFYVSQVLRDKEASKKRGDLVYVPATDVKVGDVCVRPFSSHLVTSEDFCSWGTRMTGGKFEQTLIISKETLTRLRKEYKEKTGKDTFVE